MNRYFHLFIFISLIIHIIILLKKIKFPINIKKNNIIKVKLRDNFKLSTKIKTDKQKKVKDNFFYESQRKRKGVSKIKKNKIKIKNKSKSKSKSKSNNKLKKITLKDLSLKLSSKSTQHFKVKNFNKVENKVIKLKELEELKVKFWSFYKRMKMRIDPIWNQEIHKNKYRFQNNFYSTDPKYITFVKINLDAQGFVKKVEIYKSSNNKIIDQFAIDAILKSSPFRGVPKQLLKRNIAVVFWSFIIY